MHLTRKKKHLMGKQMLCCLYLGQLIYMVTYCQDGTMLSTYLLHLLVEHSLVKFSVMY